MSEESKTLNYTVRDKDKDYHTPEEMSKILVDKNNATYIENVFKAFDIIKKKGISCLEISLINSSDSYEQYCFEMKQGYVYGILPLGIVDIEYKKALKTKEEFYLLKKVLK